MEVAPKPTPSRRTRKNKTLVSLELQCPPLPHTLMEAMKLMNQPQGPQIDQVIKMVENDPGVVARLLRVVNSAFYGQRATITSVHRAVMILGSVSVTGIVMSLGLNEVRTSLTATTALPFLHLVRHSIATAFLARHLLAKDGDEEVLLYGRGGDAYTAALLHDFGKLVLLYNHPDEAADLYTRAIKGTLGDCDPLKEEQNRFGYDHVETGLYLTRRLHFPELLATAIALHHNEASLDDETDETRHLVYLVRAANRAAAALGFPSCKAVSWKSCAEDPIWPILIEEGVVAHESVDALLQELLELRSSVEGYVDLIA